MFCINIHSHSDVRKFYYNSLSIIRSKFNSQFPRNLYACKIYLKKNIANIFLIGTIYNLLSKFVQFTEQMERFYVQIAYSNLFALMFKFTGEEKCFVKI